MLKNNINHRTWKKEEINKEIWKEGSKWTDTKKDMNE